MKRFISLLVAVVMVISISAISFNTSAAEAGTELIPDFSFENGTGWSLGGIYRTSDKAHSGSYSVKSSARGVTVLVATANSISVKPNTDYLFSGYIYRSDNSAWAYIDMNDAAGEVQLLNTEAYGKWQYVSGIWNSGSSHTVTPRIVVESNYTVNQHLGAGITGDVWFDDISFKELSYPDYSDAGDKLSSQAKSFSLTNSQISVTLAADNNKEYITELKNLKTGHSWISGAREIPLTDKYAGGEFSLRLSDFSLENQSLLEGSGAAACHTLTLSYATDIRGLTVKSVYKMYPTGPLYHYSEILNNTGRALEFNASELTLADTGFTSPSAVTLYRFNRSRYNNGFDGYFTQGVFTDSVGSNSFFKTRTENSWLLSTGMLPFILLQGDNEGLYMGYEWSYGEMLLRTKSDPKSLRLSASLGVTDDVITRENGEALLIPAVFFGAYSGDADDGANEMKQWFYNHLMTASLRENPDEPSIELSLPLYSENELKSYLRDCNLAQWGVELTKMDYWWTVPSSSGFDAYLEQQWNPDGGKWPNGMTYGTLVKEAYPKTKASLYMADTYQGVDIGTRDGRKKQLNALKQRLSDWSIDYWRSDFDLLKPNDYENHEGLMYILDELTAWSDSFRYEHCSAGGSLKDFSTLRRMTFMTMEDSGGALNHRMAFYSNSYMINPVQLKFDMGFDWTSDADAGYISSNRESWYTYNVRTAMMGAMMIQNVSSRLNDGELSALKKGWSLYKEKQRPILKGCNVYHILPMPTGSTLDGMEFYNNSIEKGSVFIFRDKSGETSKTLRLKGLEENSVYRLSFEDRAYLNCEKTGKELMQTGIYVTGLTEVYDSEIIWLERVKAAEPTTSAPTWATEPVTTEGIEPTEASSPTQPDEPCESSTAVSSTPALSTSESVIKVNPETSLTTEASYTTTASASFTVAASTVTEPLEKPILGDTDLSGKVNIKDATLIQKFAAQLTSLSEKSQLAADADTNGKINVRDATAIQKYLASYPVAFPIGVPIV